MFDDPEQGEEFGGGGDDDEEIDGGVFVEIGEYPGGEFQNGGIGLIGNMIGLKGRQGLTHGSVRGGARICDGIAADEGIYDPDAGLGQFFPDGPEAIQRRRVLAGGLEQRVDGAGEGVDDGG